MSVAFYIAAAVAVISTILVVLGRNAVHSLLYLVVSLLAVAVVFFTLGAPFIAALEVIVYAGAIMVLFIFVVMLLNRGRDSLAQESAWIEPRVWIGPGLLSGALAMEVIWLLCRMQTSLVAEQAVGPREVSLALFGPYALVVELASMLLLAGLVGAYHLGRRAPGRGEKDGS